MIYSSEGDMYEDETAHALGVKVAESGEKPVTPKAANDNVPIIPPDPYGGALLLQQWGPKGPKVAGNWDTDNPKPPKDLPTEPFPGIDTTRPQPPYGRYGPGPKDKYPPWLKEPVPFGADVSGDSSEDKTYNDLEKVYRDNAAANHISPYIDWMIKGIPLPKVGDLSDVEPSKNIEYRDSFEVTDPDGIGKLLLKYGQSRTEAQHMEPFDPTHLLNELKHGEGGGAPEAFRSPAIKHNDTGEIFEEMNHGLAFSKAEVYLNKDLTHNDVQSGFTTTRGRFVDRKEMTDIANKAEAAGVKQWAEGRGSRLRGAISEDFQAIQDAIVRKYAPVWDLIKDKIKSVKNK